MNRHQRQVVVLVLVGILVVAGLIGGGWWLGQRGQQPVASGVTTAPPSAQPTTPTAPPATPTTRVPAGTWQRLPVSPPPPSSWPEAAWTGSEMLLVGLTSAGPETESRMAYAGMAYRPAAGTWRTLPSITYPEEGNLEGGSDVVWAGSEALLAGLINGAYSPATDRWRPIASGGLGSPAVTVWTGRQVLMWGGGCCGDDVAAGAAYSPATDRWERLPVSPLPGRQETVGVWTGTELVIVGGRNADGKVLADAAAYNPATRAWRRLPAMPAPRSDAPATWTGTEVLVAGGRGAGADEGGLHGDGVAYNPVTNRWRRLPAMGTGRVWHSAVWTGRHLLVWGGRTFRAGAWTAPAHGLAYDPASDRWSPLPRSPLRGRFGHVAVWTGTSMLIWGGHPSRETDPERPFTDGAAYTPYPL